MLDAALAEFVQTLPHIARVVVHSRADLAEQSRVLDRFEETRVDYAIVGLVQVARGGNGLQKVQFCPKSKSQIYLPTVSALMI